MHIGLFVNIGIINFGWLLNRAVDLDSTLGTLNANVSLVLFVLKLGVLKQYELLRIVRY